MRRAWCTIPRARVLGGVAGHAGMFSTAADLARICQMLVDEGMLDGRRYLRAETDADHVDTLVRRATARARSGGT